MPTITPTIQNIGPRSVRVTWAGMATGDTIVSHLVRGLAAKAAVQAVGTFGVGTVVGLTGSLNDSNFAVVNDQANAAISGKTAAFLLGVAQPVTAFAPTIGSGSADSVTVTVVYEVI